MATSTAFLGRGKPGRREQPAHESLRRRATPVEVPLTGLSFLGRETPADQINCGGETQLRQDLAGSRGQRRHRSVDFPSGKLILSDDAKVKNRTSRMDQEMERTAIPGSAANGAASRGRAAAECPSITNSDQHYTRMTNSMCSGRRSATGPITSPLKNLMMPCRLEICM